MKKKMCIIWAAPKEPSYPKVWERRLSTWRKTVPRRFLSHIFPRLIIAVYFVAYNIE